MANGLYHPDDCESERTVIISELEGGENEPEQLLEIEVTAAAFKAHPYHHPTIGWLPDLRRMTRDELYGYYRRHYVPNNATLVVVGDVEQTTCSAASTVTSDRSSRAPIRATGRRSRRRPGSGV